jgi:hypothetical protein
VSALLVGLVGFSVDCLSLEASERDGRRGEFEGVTVGIRVFFLGRGGRGSFWITRVFLLLNLHSTFPSLHPFLTYSLTYSRGCCCRCCCCCCWHMETFTGGDAQGMRALFELVKEVAAQGGWPQDEAAVEAAGDGEDQ